VITEHNVPVIVGTPAQMTDLDEHLFIYEAPKEPVVVIGAGKVGRAAAFALKQRGVPVHMVEQQEHILKQLGDLPDKVVVGDAAEREILMEAGLENAPGVVISTNDDAMNIYLTLYCRRLVPNIRIVSRISHERNMDAIRRAGADLALNHNSLGVQAVFSLLRGGGDLLLLGEGVELREVAVPPALAGTSLASSNLAARTGLNVIAIQRNGKVEANPSPSEELVAGNRLFVIGEPDGFKTFSKTFS
jgi:Trk K+ transport system NAD-binding subunit